MTSPGENEGRPGRSRGIREAIIRLLDAARHFLLSRSVPGAGFRSGGFADSPLRPGEVVIPVPKWAELQAAQIERLNAESALLRARADQMLSRLSEQIRGARDHAPTKTPES